MRLAIAAVYIMLATVSALAEDPPGPGDPLFSIHCNNGDGSTYKYKYISQNYTRAVCGDDPYKSLHIDHLCFRISTVNKDVFIKIEDVQGLQYDHEPASPLHFKLFDFSPKVIRADRDSDAANDSETTNLHFRYKQGFKEDVIDLALNKSKLNVGLNWSFNIHSVDRDGSDMDESCQEALVQFNACSIQMGPCL